MLLRQECGTLSLISKYLRLTPWDLKSYLCFVLRKYQKITPGIHPFGHYELWQSNEFLDTGSSRCFSASPRFEFLGHFHQMECHCDLFCAVILLLLFCVSLSFSAHLSLSEHYGLWERLNLFIFYFFFPTTSLVELELTCTSAVQGVSYCQTGPLDYNFRQFKQSWSWDHNDNSCYVGLHPLFPPVLGFVRKANPSLVKYCIALSLKNERRVSATTNEKYCSVVWLQGQLRASCFQHARAMSVSQKEERRQESCFFLLKFPSFTP